MKWIKNLLKKWWMDIRRWFLVCDQKSILLRDAPDTTEDDILTQEMRLDSDDIFVYMLSVIKAIGFDHSSAMDILDDVKWFPMKVASVIGDFDPQIESLIDSHLPDIIKRNSKERQIIWLPEYIIKRLKEDGKFTMFHMQSLDPPVEVTLFYAKENEHDNQ